MFTSARATGSPLGVPSLSAQNPVQPPPEVLDGGPCTAMPGLSTELGLPRFGSRDVGLASCFFGEGLGNLGLLKALSPLFPPHLISFLYLDPFSVLS